MNVSGLIGSLNPNRLVSIQRVQGRVAEIEEARLSAIERLEVARRELSEAGAHEALAARAAWDALTSHFEGLAADMGRAARDLCLAILESYEKSVGDLDAKLTKLAKARIACGKSSAELGPMPVDIIERSAWLEQHGTLTGRMQGIELRASEAQEQKNLLYRLSAGAFSFDPKRGRGAWGPVAAVEEKVAREELLATFPTFPPAPSLRVLREQV